MSELALRTARLRLSKTHYCLNAMIWRFEFVESKGLGTLAVDKYYRIYYDPKIEDKWDIMQLWGVLYHECGHLLRGHNERCEALKADPLIFNYAGDAEINDDIKDENIELPGNCIYPKTFDMEEGLLAEEYYKGLIDNAEKIPSYHGGGVGGGDCGSCSGGKPRDYELPAPTKENGLPGVTAVERDLIKQQVAKDIAEREKTRGDMPGWMKRFAKDTLTPPINWKREISTSIRSRVGQISGLIDQTYSRMSRRSPLDPRIVMPGFCSHVPDIASVIDTSGSMSDTDIGECVSVVGGILNSLGNKINLNVLTVDSAMHHCKKIFKTSQIKEILNGGGGTDMRIGIDGALELKPKPQLIVVITDGYTPWPDDPPQGSKIIAVLVGKNKSEPPSWIRTIRVHNN